MLNEILLRRKMMIMPAEEYGFSNNARYVLTMMANVQSLGFTFSEELFKELSSRWIEDLEKLYLQLVPQLRKMVGANHEYKPLYPNFPNSVLEKKDAELYFNAICHYWSNGTWLPSEKKNERLPLFEDTKLRVIDLGNQQELYNIFYNLTQSKTSLSQQDREDLVQLRLFGFEWTQEIPFKETSALVCRIEIENNPSVTVKKLKKWCKTPTDILRVAVALSGGDVSLAEKSKFKSFRRRERRVLMDLLSMQENLEEEMLQRKGQWVRLGERLHPGEFNQTKYKRVREAFQSLRSGEKIQTRGGKIETAIAEGNWETAVSLLIDRPGEFARRLDKLLRICSDAEGVLNAFSSVTKYVATPVLLQVREHFLQRTEGQDYRVFFPKGSIAKCYNKKNDLPAISEEVCVKAIEVCTKALQDRFSELPRLGKVWIDTKLRNYTVPFGQRSASKALRAPGRGSRVAVGKKCVRGFIWWTNGKSRVDLDLSAVVYNEHWEYLRHVSYTALREEGMTHSGDVTNGGPIDGDGVSEFLDVDLEAVQKSGGRYVAFQVHSFCGQKFSELPNTMFGWMEREQLGSGEIYEPKTVAMKMDLGSESVSTVPAVFDCLTGEMIWCDLSMNLEEYCSRVESCMTRGAAVCYSVVEGKKPNLLELLSMHATARGELTMEKDEADVVFDEEFAYEFDKIVGEYL